VAELEQFKQNPAWTSKHKYTWTLVDHERLEATITWSRVFCRTMTMIKTIGSLQIKV